MDDARSVDRRTMASLASLRNRTVCTCAMGQQTRLRRLHTAERRANLSTIARSQGPGIDGDDSRWQSNGPDGSQQPSLAGQAQLYDVNMWASKPAWCQPYSILLTGALAVAVVNQLSGHSVLLTAVVALPIAAWWYLFLLVVSTHGT